MKILLAKRRALGDTVLLSSTIDLLSAAIPKAEVSALVPEASAPVLVDHARLKNLWTYEDGWIWLLPRIRAEGFDYFIQLHASQRIHWLSLFSGAERRLFSVQNSETEKAYGKHPNALEWDGFFLRKALGIELPLPAPPPKIFLSEAEKSEGREYWKSWGLDGRRVVFFGLGASRPTKRWPPAHFARLAELLRDRLDLVPALISGPGEEEERFCGEVLDQLRAKALRPIVGAGGAGDFVHASGLRVRKLARALSACRAYVGNDSGPKHMAVAVGIPTLTFFGPEDPVEWHPYDRNLHPVFFVPELGCRREDNGRWCGLQVCTEQKHRCMVDLDPLEVFEEFLRKVGR